MNRREALVGLTSGIVGLGAIQAEAREVVPWKSDFVARLTDARSAQRFTSRPVAESDLQKIVQAGLNAPSALNLQPWFFSVVTDRRLLDKIAQELKIKPGGRLSVLDSQTVVFVCSDDSDYGLFDAGTASDRMSVAALALGYGCKSSAQAAKIANEKFRKELGIPDKYKAFITLLIGEEETPSVDGASGATTRAPSDEKVVFIK